MSGPLRSRRDGDRAADAARFSYLHFKPACRDGHVELRAADQRDEPIPQGIGSP